jgi:hypothetical protein
LRARTGRLIYPPPASGSSCEVSLLPTVSRAAISPGFAGSPILHVGFDRAAIPAGTPFPAFNPTGIVDTGVTLTNAYVRDLLACMIEKFPNLSLTTLPPALTNTPALSGARWTGVTLTLGPLAVAGTMTLAIAGTPGGTGGVIPKAITLTFALTGNVSVGIFAPALRVGLTFTLPIAFDLNGLASITALRLSGVPLITVFTFGLGFPLALALVLAGIALASPMAVVGIAPILWLGFAALGLVVGVLPFVIVGIIGGLLGRAVGQVLGGFHRVLESTPAIPSGIFEAFGRLVPTTMVVDDLVATGVLQTPTSPWAVLPLLV